MATSREIRIAQLQAVLDDDTEAPLNQPAFAGGHAATSLVKEGYLRFTSPARTNVKTTLNGDKLISRLTKRGHVTVPEPE